MIESELFGHEAGAFTSAAEKRIGKFEHADGGTLFLDEIETMPVAAQVRLLRVLQERAVERLGSNKLIPLDLRVVAATKVDLRKAAAEGASARIFTTGSTSSPLKFHHCASVGRTSRCCFIIFYSPLAPAMAARCRRRQRSR